MISLEDKKYWVAFSQIESLGPLKFKKLYNYFPDLQTAWQASHGELKTAGLSDKDVEKIFSQQDSVNPDQEWEKLEKLGINVITVKDKNYPKLLKEIYSPPALLYIKGKLPENLDFTVAIVGTRKTSIYGRQITPEIVKELTRAGIVIVSGLALGIDALAHQSCLESNGTTIAILGCGLDRIYPITNKDLGQRIVEKNGAIISCLLYTSPSPRDLSTSRMPSSA